MGVTECGQPRLPIPSLLHPVDRGEAVTQQQQQTTRVRRAGKRRDNNLQTLDVEGRYALPFGTRVIQRATDCVQIGTEPPRTVVIRNAPVHAAAVLSGLDGGRTVAELLQEHEPTDHAGWLRLLEELLSVGALLRVNDPERAESPMTVGAHLTEERAALTHRYGHAAAARILQARDDALVVVRGNGDVAFSITAHLAAAGIGHLHHDTQRRTLPWLPVGQATHGLNMGSAESAADSGTASAAAAARRSADLRSRYPALRLHSPAAHHHPTAVVLSGGTVPDLGLAAGYSRAQVPYLSVATSAARVVVGPFVLPGRSPCLLCIHRHRTDADPQWPAVAGQLGAASSQTSAMLTAAAVCLAVGEVLEYVDGVQPPRTVDGTVEWPAGGTGPRRRTWLQHPDCGCRTTHGS